MIPTQTYIDKKNDLAFHSQIEKTHPFFYKNWQVFYKIDKDLLKKYYNFLLKDSTIITDLSLLFPTTDQIYIKPKTNFILLPFQLPTTRQITRKAIQPATYEWLKSIDYSNLTFRERIEPTDMSPHIRVYQAVRMNTTRCIKRVHQYTLLEIPNIDDMKNSYMLHDTQYRSKRTLKSISKLLDSKLQLPPADEFDKLISVWMNIKSIPFNKIQFSRRHIMSAMKTLTISSDI